MNRLGKYETIGHLSKENVTDLIEALKEAKEMM